MVQNTTLPLPYCYISEILSRVDSLGGSADTGSGYFGELLQLMANVVCARHADLWHHNGVNLEVLVRIGDDGDWSQQVREMAYDVGHNNSPAIQYANADTSSKSGAAFLLVPLNDDQRCFAVASLIVNQQNPQAVEANLAVLVAISERIARNYAHAGHARSMRELSQLKKAQTVVDSIGNQLEIKPMAYTVVNRLQGYLKADRVSLAICRGAKSQIKGISNQALFDRRSNVVKQLENLASQVANMEERFVYPISDDSVPPRLKQLAEKYFEGSNSVAIALLPIFAQPKRREDPEDIATTIQTSDEAKRCIGVLILEGVERPLELDRILRRWGRVESAISHNVNNSRQHDGLFLMPVWRSLGTFADLYRGHTQRKALLITGLIAAALLSLVLVPGEFKIRGEGVIQPIVRQHVYAEAEGTIDSLRAQEGAMVKQGDLLINLRNPELAARVADIAGKLREAEVQFQTVTMQRISRTFANEQEERDLVRTASTSEAKISGLKEQLALLEKSQRQLEIRSPIDGQVITWDTEQRLRDRPVKPGQRLLTVADASGDWEIELRIPDKRAGYLLQEWQNCLQQDRPMMASFVLTSDATQVYQGTVLAVSPNSHVDDKESENVVRVRVSLSEETFAKIVGTKPGTSVIGQVHCGNASIGYCKLYEFFDWIHREWFRFVA